MSGTKIAVGDTVFVQVRKSNVLAEPKPAVVAKVGRKWATLESHTAWPKRFKIEDEDDPRNKAYALDGRGFSSPGQVWLSMEDYHDAMRREAAWKVIVVQGRNPPLAVSTEAMESMAEAIRADNEEPAR